jgi:hypothetical protein
MTKRPRLKTAAVNLSPWPVDFSKDRGVFWNLVASSQMKPCSECGGNLHIVCDECAGKGSKGGRWCIACEGQGASACEECEGLGMVPALPAGRLAYPLPVDFQPRGDEDLPDGVALVQIMGWYFLAPLNDVAGTADALRRAYHGLGYLPPACLKD